MQINRMRWAAGMSALLVLAAWPSAAAAQMFVTVEEAIAYANDWIAEGERGSKAAIVLSVQTEDETPRRIDGKIERVPAGHRNASFSTGSAWVDTTRAGELIVRLRVEGYHEFEKRVQLQPGEVLVLDDIRPERIDPQDSIDILGMVKLEDGASAESIHVRAGTATAQTDAHGRFRLSGLGAGEVRILASKEGYEGLKKTIHAKKGDKTTIVIEGWRKRYALVRWAYQPDGSRDLSAGIESGKAIVDSRNLERVSFKEGFVRVNRHSDFLIYQRNDHLFMRNFDQGKGNPGIVELPGATFDEVREIPEVEFATRHHVLREGYVYLFRSYNGDYYAKMQVLEIIDNERDYMRLIADMARE